MPSLPWIARTWRGGIRLKTPRAGKSTLYRYMMSSATARKGSRSGRRSRSTTLPPKKLIGLGGAPGTGRATP
eukprot:13785420-Alexandrium_andersonii.AAC.1